MRVKSGSKAATDGVQDDLLLSPLDCCGVTSFEVFSIEAARRDDLGRDRVARLLHGICGNGE